MDKSLLKFVRPDDIDFSIEKSQGVNICAGMVLLISAISYEFSKGKRSGEYLGGSGIDIINAIPEWVPDIVRDLGLVVEIFKLLEVPIPMFTHASDSFKTTSDTWEKFMESGLSTDNNIIDNDDALKITNLKKLAQAFVSASTALSADVSKSGNTFGFIDLS